jgi:hypothetical protein
VLSSGTRLGSSAPNQEANRGQKEPHVFSYESPKVATFDSAKDVASSSSGQSNYQVPSVIYIDGVPDLTPNLHFKTTFSGEAIIETVENVYEEFQPTAYEWNRNNFMWRSYSTRSASPFKASCHVFKDPTNAEAGVCFWVEMRLVEGDGQDFFDLFARMQFALAPESMAGAMPGASGSLMRTPDAGFGFGLPSPEDTRVVCSDERKAVMGHVLQLCKCKAPYQRQHALKLMCEVALQDNAECLHTMCDMGCVEACLGEIVSDECSMNTQLAVTVLQALTRYTAVRISVSAAHQCIPQLT